MAVLRSDRGTAPPPATNGKGGGGGLFLLIGAGSLAFLGYELLKPKGPSSTATTTTVTSPPPPTAPLPPSRCSDNASPPSYWSTLDPAGKATAATFCILVGREPEPSAQSFWDQVFVSGGPQAPGYTGIPAVAIGIINDESEEYRVHQDAWANYICATEVACEAQYALAWVIGLYENLLGRHPLTSESAYWVPIWNAQGRLQVAMDFVNGPEFASRVQQQVAAWGG